jgi:hypothetical protein
VQLRSLARRGAVKRSLQNTGSTTYLHDVLCTVTQHVSGTIAGSTTTVTNTLVL